MTVITDDVISEHKKYEQELIEDVETPTKNDLLNNIHDDVVPIEKVGYGYHSSASSRINGKRVIQEHEVYDKLGYAFPAWKKWGIITVIFVCQLSMNFNGSVYPHALSLISKEFHVSSQKANVSQMIFKVAYGFACELWAPWSEELGRRWTLQVSLFLTNIWQILGGLAPNYGSIIVARFLAGMSQAGGSVTLGIVADMWLPQDHGYAVAYVVLASVLGAVIGPVFGGLMEEYLSWQWNFWIQLIFGGVTQFMHFCLVPETRASILMDREARRRRHSGEDLDIYGPHEVKSLNLHDIVHTWLRPFYMFICEPIVLFCSLLSGFADHLIFISNQSFTPIYKQWHFSTTACGLIFISLVVSYAIAYPLHVIDIYYMRKRMEELMNSRRGPERRLLLLLYLAPLLPIGLFGFAWTSMGPSYTPWIAPTIFVTLIGIANYSVYMATIDYMVAAYGPYSSSATGGNGLTRDVLSGIAAMYSGPLYNNIGGKFHFQWGSTLLGGLSVICIIPIYIFYWKGPLIRKKSKFAQEISRHLEDEEEHINTEYGDRTDSAHSTIHKISHAENFNGKVE